jgi:hypothetical protein
VRCKKEGGTAKGAMTSIKAAGHLHAPHNDQFTAWIFGGGVIECRRARNLLRRKIIAAV